MLVNKSRVLYSTREIARSVNEQLNIHCSLYGNRRSNCKGSKVFKDDRILQLASRHLGLNSVDDLLALSPCHNARKLPNSMAGTKIIYEDSIKMNLDKGDNDIWLGHLRFLSHLCINLEDNINSLYKKYKHEREKCKNPDDSHCDVSHSVKYPLGQMKPAGDSASLEFPEITSEEVMSNSSGSTELSEEISTRHEGGIGTYSVEMDGVYEDLLKESGTSDEDYTIFVYPYMRRTSKVIVDLLSVYRSLLSPLDVQSLIYLSGSTGSSRLLRYLSRSLSEHFSAVSSSSITRVEFHAWPWMNNTKDEQAVDNIKLPLLMDALLTADVIKYTFDHEHNMLEWLHKELQILDNIAHKLSEETPTNNSTSAAESSPYLNLPENSTPPKFPDISSENNPGSPNTISGCMNLVDERGESIDRGDELQKYEDENRGVVDADPSTESFVRAIDDVVLEKVVQMILLKRNLNRLSSEYIRIFSDFICERLHRINSKCIANIACAIGHSKHLDEFWMFMMAKHIQETIAIYDTDDLVAIVDAYSTASLEDHNFYETICNEIKLKFNEFNIHHIALVLRSLAKVRVRDEELLNNAIQKLKIYAARGICTNERSNDVSTCANNSSLYHNGRARGEEVDTPVSPPFPSSSTSGSLAEGGKGKNTAGREGGTHNRRRDTLVLDPYVIASGIVSAGDLDYKGDDLDELWSVLTQRVRDSSFDICAVNWLPLATITFASNVALKAFLPIWIKHVHYTIQKLRSRTFMMTIQRRHALLRHAFNLEILPSGYVPNKCMKILDDICNKNYITCREDYIPESSTFHLEVCACLKALDVAHQREINIIPFVMDIVIPPEKDKCIRSQYSIDVQRKSDEARCGNLAHGDLDGFRLKYTRHSPNHRKHKDEIYIYNK